MAYEFCKVFDAMLRRWSLGKAGNFMRSDAVNAGCHEIQGLCNMANEATFWLKIRAFMSKNMLIFQNLL